MARATGVIIRKAQVQSNRFEPAWTCVGKQGYLFGYPVSFSASMTTAARAAAPVLIGDFKLGFVIGDRGGSGIKVTILDQPLATQGQIQLLTYRRTDGRVRRSEAIQQYNVAAS
jgi:HK97 family phage major capsid protein